MHSNHASHLLLTSTFQSFKSGLFPISPEVLDSNRLSIKIPTEQVMYTQGEKSQTLSAKSTYPALRKCRIPFKQRRRLTHPSDHF